VLKAPTHFGVCGRVFLGSLSLAFYCARRLIRIQDTSGDTLPLRQARPSGLCCIQLNLVDESSYYPDYIAVLDKSTPCNLVETIRMYSEDYMGLL
jgi:hypothetical protein